MDVIVNIPQAVFDHAVDQFPIAHPIPFTGLLQEVRCPRHVFSPSRYHNRSVAALDRLGCQHDRFKTGSADFINRERSDFRSEAGANRRLPGNVLTEARADHVAKDDFVYLFGWNSGTSDGRFNHCAAKNWRGCGVESAAECSDRSTDSAGQIHAIFHNHCLKLLAHEGFLMPLWLRAFESLRYFFAQGQSRYPKHACQFASSRRRWHALHPAMRPKNPSTWPGAQPFPALA